MSERIFYHSAESGRTDSSTRSSKRRSLCFLLLPLLLTVSCTDYWWSRGQPPGVPTLVARGREKLAEARSERAEHRQDVAQISQSLEESLISAARLLEEGTVNPAEVTAALTKAEEEFMALEGKLSVGSRAAYGELAGQLRVFLGEARSGQQPPYAPFGLFTARTLSFLANELTMPAPVVG